MYAIVGFSNESHKLTIIEHFINCERRLVEIR